MTTTEWARAHGVHHRGTIALDNYEPTRDFTVIDCYSYERDGDRCWVLDGPMHLRDGSSAIYLMDDGRTVEPHYVAGYHPEGEHVIIHPFPTNFDTDGSPRLRADDSRPVDYGTWMLGPKRAYHVKLTAAN